MVRTAGMSGARHKQCSRLPWPKTGATYHHSKQKSKGRTIKELSIGKMDAYIAIKTRSMFQCAWRIVIFTTNKIYPNILYVEYRLRALKGQKLRK